MGFCKMNPMKTLAPPPAGPRWAEAEGYGMGARVG
jgi:hypothetical protein